MFSKRFFCAVIVLLVIIGLATATFQGSSSCGIQIHRASGKVLWCESQQDSPGSNQNITIYVAPMNATNNRVAILNFLSLSPIMSTGSSTYASPYLDTESGRIMIVVSTYTHSPSSGMPPFPITTFTGFHILTGSIQDLTSFTTVYTNATAMEQAQATQTWVNGVFLFSTSLSDTNSVSYKAFVPNNNNGLSLVNIFPYSTITQTSVHAWAMDGTSRLCLSVTADESYIVCRAVSNSSTDLVIHTDANTLTFITVVSDNNGRIFWSEINGTNSWRVWAANSDKSDTPAVLDRTTNETYVSTNVMYGNNLAFGYDSYNKLVYWTELIPLPSSTEYTFGVYGWDGKTNAVVTYFGASNTSETITQICTSNGQMILATSELSMMISMPFPTSATQRLYHTSPSSNGTPTSSLLLSHSFQMTMSFILACDEESGWAVLGLSDTMNQIGSAVAAIRIDNTTTLSLQYSTDVNITLGTSMPLTDGIVGYSLGNVALGFYDLFFYTLVPDEVAAVPSDGSNNSPSSSNTTPMPGPSTSTTPINGPSGKVSFANQMAPLMYIASLALFF